MAVRHKMDYARLVQLIENVKRNTIEPTKVANFMVSYVSGNSYKTAAKHAGVVASTARSWQQQDWFPEALEAARGVAGQKVDRKLTKIIDMALGNVEERLTIGEPYKDGKGIAYKPVGAYQSALIAGIAFDKRALSRGEPTSIEAGISFEDRLKSLQGKFEEVGASKPDLKIVKT